MFNGSALDAGADDMQADEEMFHIYTDPSAMTAVRDALQAERLRIGNSRSYDDSGKQNGSTIR